MKLLLQVYIQKYTAGKSLIKGIRQQPINLTIGNGLNTSALFTLCGVLYPLVLGKFACSFLLILGMSSTSLESELW